MKKQPPREIENYIMERLEIIESNSQFGNKKALYAQSDLYKASVRPWVQMVIEKRKRLKEANSGLDHKEL